MISIYANAIHCGSLLKYLGCTEIVYAIVVSHGKEKTR
jgi:hypothetical protein